MTRLTPLLLLCSCIIAVQVRFEPSATVNASASAPIELSGVSGNLRPAASQCVPCDMLEILHDPHVERGSKMWTVAVFMLYGTTHKCGIGDTP